MSQSGSLKDALQRLEPLQINSDENMVSLPEEAKSFTVVKMNEGNKYDGDKLPIDLIPPEMLTALASVLKYGAIKYEPRNWEKGMRWGRVFAALMRHMWAWWRGENEDEETKMSHLWHAACCIAFLVAYEARGIGQDDRTKQG